MLNDNILSDRLNLFRTGEIDEAAISINNDNDIDLISPKLDTYLILLKGIINGGVVFLRSLAYGFAVKTIFATDWRFIAFLAVGFSLDLIITNITSIFNKEDK